MFWMNESVWWVVITTRNNKNEQEAKLDQGFHSRQNRLLSVSLFETSPKKSWSKQFFFLRACFFFVRSSPFGRPLPFLEAFRIGLHATDDRGLTRAASEGKKTGQFSLADLQCAFDVWLKLFVSWTQIVCSDGKNPELIWLVSHRYNCQKDISFHKLHSAQGIIFNTTFFNI